MDTFLGLLYVLLWASASVAAKFLRGDAAPLTALAIRFAIAGGLLCAINYVIMRGNRMPRGAEWRHLAVLGFCNSTGYLGLAWLAIPHVPVGLFNLTVATGPFVVALLSRLWLGRVIMPREWLGMLIAAGGLIVVVAPSLGLANATPLAVGMVALAVVINSVGSVYARRVQLQLPPFVVNGWQLVFGVLMLLPFAAVLNNGAEIRPSPNLLLAIGWSALPVSIGAMAIWFGMVRKDALRASTWLFLTPIAGYALAALLLGEPVHIWDAAGALFVMIGLAVSGTINVRALVRR